MTRHPDRLMALVLLAIVLALFAPVIVQPGGLIYPSRGDYSDLTITHWPNIAFAVESLRTTGRLPLWRPTIMSGTPFAANPLSGMFYFPHVIFLVLPLAVGFNVLFIAHVWLSGCGAYVLLREWQVGRPAALIGALTWMATPKFFAHLGLGHLGMVEAVAWLPWAVLVTQRMFKSWRTMDAVWLGAVWAIQFLADPRISFYTIVLTATLILFLLQRAQLKTLMGRLVALVVFAALSAILWLPFAEFITQSNRGALTLAEGGEWSLPWRQLVSLVLADWSGSHEWAVYVGILPLITAVVGIRLFRDTHGTHHAWMLANGNRLHVVILWLVCASVAAILFSLGVNGPLFPLVFRVLPGLTMLRVPPRVWFIVAFAVAMLCAFGIEAMMRKVNKPRSWVTLVSVAVAFFALLFGLGGFFVLLNDPQAASARASLLHLALVVPISVLVVLLRVHERVSPRAFAALSSAVIVGTLLPVDLSFYRVVSEAQAFSDHVDVAAWLARQQSLGIYRIYSPSYSLPQHVAQRAGLELADGVDPMQIARYARLMAAATGTGASGYSVTIPTFPPKADVRAALRDVKPDARLLGKLNVHFVVAEFPMQVEGLIERARFGATFVYENQFAMPRAYIGDGTPARIVINTPDRVVVQADGPGTLTLSQINYPGWRATVDGRAAPIKTVESALMGVELDAGHHEIEFVFDPWTVKVGVIASGVGWGGLVAGWLVSRLKKGKKN